MATRTPETIRNRTAFEEIDRRFVTESISAVVEYIDSLKLPIKITQSNNGYIPEEPKSERTALFQNSDVYLDSGAGRVSDGLRGLELLSKLCRGVPYDNLFMFNNVIYSSTPNKVKTANRDELIQIVIDNLGLTTIIPNAEKVSKALVDDFKELCYSIGYAVRSGTFKKENVQNQVLRYGKKLAIAASRSATVDRS